MNDPNSLIQAAQEMRQAREIKLQEERDARARELSQQAASKLLNQQRKELFDNERLHIARDFLELIQGSHIQPVLFKREGRDERRRYYELVSSMPQYPPEYRQRWVTLSPFEKAEKRIRKRVWDETPEREGYEIFNETLTIDASETQSESQSPQRPSLVKIPNYLYVSLAGEVIESLYAEEDLTITNWRLTKVLAEFSVKNSLIV